MPTPDDIDPIQDSKHAREVAIVAPTRPGSPVWLTQSERSLLIDLVQQEIARAKPDLSDPGRHKYRKWRVIAHMLQHPAESRPHKPSRRLLKAEQDAG